MSCQLSKCCYRQLSGTIEESVVLENEIVNIMGPVIFKGGVKITGCELRMLNPESSISFDKLEITDGKDAIFNQISDTVLTHPYR
jgi:hypothetical protein